MTDQEENLDDIISSLIDVDAEEPLIIAEEKLTHRRTSNIN